ncbi:MAG TPA: MFS transporter [Bryobacteraceae bacterium]|nr:MFS transporter [Bryobacteraceae bacterium]
MKKRHRVLLFLTSLSAITFVDRLAIGVAGPRIQDALHIPPERWGWVLGAFILGYGIFEIPTGASGDRIGQGRVLTRIVVWWSAFTALTAAAGGFVSLLATQFLFGAGEAGAYPNMAGVAGRWFPAAERGRAQGAVWAASRIGGALSPLLAVPLLRAAGWRAMFCVLAGFGLIWTVLWRWWYHDRPEDQPGITAAELDEIGPPRLRNPHAEAPWRALLASRQVWLLCGMYWCYVWAAWFYYSWFPTYMVRGAGFSESEMGLLSALPFLLGCAGNVAGGFLTDFLSKRHGLKVGRCVLAASSLATSALLILALAFTRQKAAVVLLASAGFGVLDLMLPATWSFCLDIGRGHAGVITATMNTSGLAGGFVCTVLFGYLVRETGGYRVPLCVIAAMVMIASMLFLFLDPSKPVWETD